MAETWTTWTTRPNGFAIALLIRLGASREAAPAVVENREREPSCSHPLPSVKLSSLPVAKLARRS